MSVCFPQGQFIAGDSLVLGYLENHTLYLLTDVSSDQTLSQYSSLMLQNAYKNTVTLEPSDAMANLVVYEINGSRSNLQLTGDSNFSYKIDSDGLIMVASDTAISVAASQDVYQEWNPPEVLLACANYRFYVPGDNSNPFKCYIKRDTGDPVLLDVGLITIAVVSYSGCNGQTCNQYTSAQDAVDIAYCSMTDSDSTGCLMYPSQSWTTASDAAQGKGYNYCNEGVNCSTNCKGPCTQDNYSCVYDGEIFVCRFSVNNLFSGQWWKKPWFLVLMVIVAVFIIITLVVAFLAANGETKSAIPYYGYEIAGKIE